MLTIGFLAAVVFVYYVLKFLLKERTEEKVQSKYEATCLIIVSKNGAQRIF